MRNVKEGPAEKVTADRGLDGSEGAARMGFGGVCSRQGKQQGARPCSREQVGGMLAAVGGACGGQVRQVVDASWGGGWASGTF